VAFTFSAAAFRMIAAVHFRGRCVQVVVICIEEMKHDFFARVVKNSEKSDPSRSMYKIKTLSQLQFTYFCYGLNLSSYFKNTLGLHN
jgi:hypothetical protein